MEGSCFIAYERRAESNIEENNSLQTLRHLNCFSLNKATSLAFVVVFHCVYVEQIDLLYCIKPNRYRTQRRAVILQYNKAFATLLQLLQLAVYGRRLSLNF